MVAVIQMLFLLASAKSLDPRQIVRGSLIDPRDGRSYATVKIGRQTWMAENIAFETEQSWCYQQDSTHCALLGRLYDWHAAKVACPDGWRLPTASQWKELERDVGGSQIAGFALKTNQSWENNGAGQDTYHFNVLPAGSRVDDGRFGSIGYVGAFWLLTDSNSQYAFHELFEWQKSVSRFAEYKASGLSVRCVQESKRSKRR